MKSAPNILRPRSMRCSRMPPPPSSARARPIRPRPGKRSCSLPNARPSRSRAWGVVGHLNAAADTPALRAAHAENLPRITRFWSSVGQNRALYQKYKAIAESRAFDTFSQARRQVILNALRDFRLAGAELDDSEKPRFAALQERQAALSKEFADHALDATDAYSIRITQEDELAGLPDNARAAARNAAEKAGAAGWRFTLHL